MNGDNQVKGGCAGPIGNTKQREPDMSRRLWKSKKQSQVAPCDLLLHDIKVDPLVPLAPFSLCFAAKRMYRGATIKVTILMNNYNASCVPMRLKKGESTECQCRCADVPVKHLNATLYCLDFFQPRKQVLLRMCASSPSKMG